MYSNIKVYQKYLVTSIKVGCATRSPYASSGPKAEGVPTYNQRGLPSSTVDIGFFLSFYSKNIFRVLNRFKLYFLWVYRLVS